MDITEVRIKLMEDPQERLQAFCSITFDHCFVIRDLKIIEGAKGSFVAMPSRSPTAARAHRTSSAAVLQSVRRAPARQPGRQGRRRALSCTPTSPTPSTRCRELIQKKVMIPSRRAGQPASPGTSHHDDYGEENTPTSPNLKLGRPAYSGRWAVRWCRGIEREWEWAVNAI